MSKHQPIRPASGDARTANTASSDASPVPDFEPVATHRRIAGWSPDKQTDFIEALAECGCVTEACARVGMSSSSAYALRRRVDAQSFRQAWDAALDYAIRRLSDAAFSRALHGVSRPVFYQGQQIGERRHFDERLTMFLLRYRDPLNYGAWLDQIEFRRPADGAAIALAKMVDRVADHAWAAEFGDPPPRQGAVSLRRHVDPAEHAAQEEIRREERYDAFRRLECQRWEKELGLDPEE